MQLESLAILCLLCNETQSEQPLTKRPNSDQIIQTYVYVQLKRTLNIQFLALCSFQTEYLLRSVLYQFNKAASDLQQFVNLFKHQHIISYCCVLGCGSIKSIHSDMPIQGKTVCCSVLCFPRNTSCYFKFHIILYFVG